MNEFPCTELIDVVISILYMGKLRHRVAETLPEPGRTPDFCRCARNPPEMKLLGRLQQASFQLGIPKEVELLFLLFSGAEGKANHPLLSPQRDLLVLLQVASPQGAPP